MSDKLPEWWPEKVHWSYKVNYLRIRVKAALYKGYWRLKHWLRLIFNWRYSSLYFNHRGLYDFLYEEGKWAPKGDKS